MKKFIYIITVVFITPFLSCNDNLEIEENFDFNEKTKASLDGEGIRILCLPDGFIIPFGCEESCNIENGLSLTIGWEFSGFCQTIYDFEHELYFDLIKPNGQFETNIHSQFTAETDDNGQFTWNIPASTPEGDYRILLHDFNDLPMVLSNEFFLSHGSIDPDPDPESTIVITSPVFQFLDPEIPINWDLSFFQGGVNSTVVISITHDTTGTTIGTQKNISNDGEYTWSTNGLTLQSHNSYTIKITGDNGTKSTEKSVQYLTGQPVN